MENNEDSLKPTKNVQDIWKELLAEESIGSIEESLDALFTILNTTKQSPYFLHKVKALFNHLAIHKNQPFTTYLLKNISNLLLHNTPFEFVFVVYGTFKKAITTMASDPDLLSALQFILQLLGKQQCLIPKEAFIVNKFIELVSRIPTYSQLIQMIQYNFKNFEHICKFRIATISDQKLNEEYQAIAKFLTPEHCKDGLHTNVRSMGHILSLCTEPLLVKHFLQPLRILSKRGLEFLPAVCEFLNIYSSSTTLILGESSMQLVASVFDDYLSSEAANISPILSFLFLHTLDNTILSLNNKIIEIFRQIKNPNPRITAYCQMVCFYMQSAKSPAKITQYLLCLTNCIQNFHEETLHIEFCNYLTSASYKAVENMSEFDYFLYSSKALQSAKSLKELKPPMIMAVLCSLLNGATYQIDNPKQLLQSLSFQVITNVPFNMIALSCLYELALKVPTVGQVMIADAPSIHFMTGESSFVNTKKSLSSLSFCQVFAHWNNTLLMLILGIGIKENNLLLMGNSIINELILLNATQQSTIFNLVTKKFNYRQDKQQVIIDFLINAMTSFVYFTPYCSNSILAIKKLCLTLIDSKSECLLQADRLLRVVWLLHLPIKMRDELVPKYQSKPAKHFNKILETLHIDKKSTLFNNLCSKMIELGFSRCGIWSSNVCFKYCAINILILTANSSFQSTLVENCIGFLNKELYAKVMKANSIISETLSTTSIYDLSLRLQQITDILGLYTRSQKAHIGVDSLQPPESKPSQPIEEYRKEILKELNAMITHVNSFYNSILCTIVGAAAESVTCMNEMINHKLLTHLRKLLVYSEFQKKFNDHIRQIITCNPKCPFYHKPEEFLQLLCITPTTNKSEIKHIYSLIEYAFEKIELSSIPYRAVVYIARGCRVILKSLYSSISHKSKAIDLLIKIIDATISNPPVILTKIMDDLLGNIILCENFPHFLREMISKNSSQIPLLLSKLNSYSPMNKIMFMNAIIESNVTPLMQEESISPIWENIFEESKEISSSAIKIWNSLALVPISIASVDIESSITKHLFTKNQEMTLLAIRALSCYWEAKGCIDDDWCRVLVQSYKSVSIEDGLLIKKSIIRQFSCVTHVFNYEQIEKLIKFLCDAYSIAHKNKEVIETDIIQCSHQITKERGALHASEMLKFLSQSLEQVHSEDDKNFYIITIGALAPYLDSNSQILQDVYKKMLQMIDTGSNNMKLSIAKNIPYFAKKFTPIFTTILNETLTYLSLESDIEKLTSLSYRLAGIIKGLGIRLIEEKEIVKMIKDNLESTDSRARTQALAMFTALVEVEGRAFECYGIMLFPSLLKAFMEKKGDESLLTYACKVFMANLSSEGLKQVMPNLLLGISSDNWRSKLASVEGLGSMAFIIPKQLSLYLPKIVSKIREIISDTNSKVKDAGVKALYSICSVIRNPEIADISQQIINALEDSSKLSSALNLLLGLSFSHAIDSPSLSLVIPLIDFGLTNSDHEVKKKATLLIGSISKLVLKPEDLIPYIPTIMPSLHSSLFDTIPQVRAYAARALGKLCEGIGLFNSQGILKTLKDLLMSDCSLTIKTGAAQALAEVISAFGNKQFESELLFIMNNCRHQDSFVREGFIGMFMFFPYCLGEYVEKKICVILPIIIDKLNDDVETVRAVSKKVIQIFIKQYAKSNTSLLLRPLLGLMCEENYKLRLNAMSLISDLVQAQQSNLVKMIPTCVSEAEKKELLITLFISRQDIEEEIAIIAKQTWRMLIENQIKAVVLLNEQISRKVIDMNKKSNSQIVSKIANIALIDVLDKFHEKTMATFITMCKEIASIGDEDYTELKAMITTLSHLIYNLSAHIVPHYINEFYEIIQPFLLHDEEEIRVVSSSALSNIMKKDATGSIVGKLCNYVVSLIKMDKSQLTDEKFTNLCDAINSAFKSQNKWARDFILELTEEPFTNFKLIMIHKLLDFFIKEIFTSFRFNKFISKLVNICIDLNSPLYASSFNLLIEIYTDVTKVEYSDGEKYITDLISTPIDDKLALYCRIITSLIGKERHEVIKKLEDIFETAIPMILSPNMQLSVDSLNLCNAIISYIPKEELHCLIRALTQVLTRIEIDTKSREFFNLPHSIEYLFPILLNSLLHGSLEIRMQASQLYILLLRNLTSAQLKLDISKIIGSIIRVIIDKFPSSLKLLLLEAIYISLTKDCPSLKTFALPLQTTLTKLLYDPSMTDVTRELTIECLILNVKHLGKPDSCLTDLINNMSIQPAMNIKSSIIVCIAHIIRYYGGIIRNDLKNVILNKLFDAIEKNKDNSVIMLSVSFALANLSQFSDKSYDIDIYNFALKTIDSVYSIMGFAYVEKVETQEIALKKIKDSLTTAWKASPKQGFTEFLALLPFITKYGVIQKENDIIMQAASFLPVESLKEFSIQQKSIAYVKLTKLATQHKCAKALFENVKQLYGNEITAEDEHGILLKI